MIRRKIFVSQCRKKSKGNSSLFHRNSGTEKKYGEEGLEYQEFPSEILCLTLPKNFVGNPLVVHYFWVSTNFMLQRAKSRFSVEKIFSHSAENFRRRPL